MQCHAGGPPAHDGGFLVQEVQPATSVCPCGVMLSSKAMIADATNTSGCCRQQYRLQCSDSMFSKLSLEVALISKTPLARLDKAIDRWIFWKASLQAPLCRLVRTHSHDKLLDQSFYRRRLRMPDILFVWNAV